MRGTDDNLSYTDLRCMKKLNLTPTSARQVQIYQRLRARFDGVFAMEQALDDPELGPWLREEVAPHHDASCGIDCCTSPAGAPAGRAI